MHYSLSLTSLILGQDQSTKNSSSESTSSKLSKISTQEIEEIIDRLKYERHRSSTRSNYLCVWRQFNAFFLRLDRKPTSWEDRVVLFTAFLVNEQKKSTTIKSYVSAVKAVLANEGIELNENRYLLNSLTHACKLKNSPLKG